MKPITVVVVLVAVIVLGGFLVLSRGTSQPSSEPTEVIETSAPSPTQPRPQTTETTKLLKGQDISGAHADYRFTALVPTSWQAEAVGATEAINLFDPQAAGESNLEKSQIFIRKFVASDFLTLNTVTIHSREKTTINNRPAVRYDIEKKSGVTNFANQPNWRSSRHIVTDVRVSDSKPSVFYVIAKRPELDDQTYQNFLNSLKVVANTSLIEPINEFNQRITKKPFGIFITPETSPVQPERFSGYHTGVDVEYEDKPDQDVGVSAIADGTVSVSNTATGYGGVLVIRHEIKGKPRAVIYGHLDPASLPAVGAKIKRGEQIGILGEGNTKETDGERKHLHFGVRADDRADIRGYVSRKGELTGWQNPLELYQ